MFEADDEHFDLKSLLRLGAWGMGAAVALAVAVAASQLDSGSTRISGTSSSKTPTARPSAASLLARPSADDEALRLAEAVRTLTADRDRMAHRIAALERNLDDLTGSIPRPTPSTPDSTTMVAPDQSAGTGVPDPSTPSPASAPLAVKPPEVSAPAGVSAPASLPPTTTPQNPAAQSTLPVVQVPVMTAAPAQVPSPQSPAAQAPAAQAPAAPPASPAATVSATVATSQVDATTDNAALESVATRTEFAVDLGGATSVQRLRQLWGLLKSRQPSLLDGLRPLMAVRETARPGGMQLRLIVGPLADAEAAARLCAIFLSAGRVCETTVFDGQRLALR